MCSRAMQSQKLNMADSHPVVKGALFKIFPTAQHGYNLSGNDGYPEYGIIGVDIYPGEYELKE